MKKKWMKMVALLLGVGGVMVGVGGCEKNNEEEARTVRVLAVKPAFGTQVPHESRIQERISQAEVKFYRTLPEYLAGENAFAVGYTDVNGEVAVIAPQGVDTVWIGATFENLDNYRYTHYYLNGNSDCTNEVHSRFIIGQDKKRITILTPPVAQLHLKVFHDGQPITDQAGVQLYFSKEDFDNRLLAGHNYDQLEASYGYIERELYSQDGGTRRCWHNTFNKFTDENGEVVFDNLEEKQYWFVIGTYSGLSNKSGTITIGAPLIRNKTTSLTVGLDQL